MTVGFSHAPTERQRQITRRIASVRNNLRRAPSLDRRPRSQTETTARHAVSPSETVSGPKSQSTRRDNPAGLRQRFGPRALLANCKFLRKNPTMRLSKHADTRPEHGIGNEGPRLPQSTEPPPMPSISLPTDLSPDERFRCIASILARGVRRRLEADRRSRTSGSESSESTAESLSDGLELRGETRLSVSRQPRGVKKLSRALNTAKRRLPNVCQAYISAEPTCCRRR